MLAGNLFCVLHPWNANDHWPYDLVLVAAMLRMFWFDDEHGSLAGVYMVKRQIFGT